ncbi:hypothetical protein [Paenibacillus agilis]|uniref:Uncharacterized protein n=1 Tax=Paenibacillus agilis TaxID=3020863 RepID=A0A559IEG5_9BACL|nr:hypothetical protein [Paenibacillus agilis]TVX86035.1 hypothetical protein FPZ44_24135 [Paenibacillus agilis]
MGKVLYMNKRDEGIAKYMKINIDTSKLKRGVDFHIASIFVVDENFGVNSLGGFLKESSNELFQKLESDYIGKAKKLLDGKGSEGFMETPHHEGVPFYKVNGDINIDLATEIGLGVVNFQGEYMLYAPSSKNDPMDAVTEMLMLKVYFQLMYPNEIDQKLGESFSRLRNTILTNMTANQAKHINRLKEIFKVV